MKKSRKKLQNELNVALQELANEREIKSKLYIKCDEYRAEELELKKQEFLKKAITEEKSWMKNWGYDGVHFKEENKIMKLDQQEITKVYKTDTLTGISFTALNDIEVYIVTIRYAKQKSIERSFYEEKNRDKFYDEFVEVAFAK